MVNKERNAMNDGSVPVSARRSASPEVKLALIATLAGGGVTFVGAVAGLGPISLVMGAAVTVGLILLGRRRCRGVEPTAALGFGFAFVALTWPLLWAALALIAEIVFSPFGWD
jgi:hypothetical protein